MSQIREDLSVNSLIGEGARFVGDIELSGFIRIDGDFSGAIRKADKVLVGKTGRVKSSTTARVVIIAGAFIGDIIAEEHLTILSSAIVIGNIKAPVIVMESGVIFHGNCQVTNQNLDIATDEQKNNSSFIVNWK
jgi:cytoskeletal protein CcmA (bactofilin family)